ncbi:protein BREAKING OF ASYMMETRY IN THE STOMATAL LINEAGE [Punica granatum]|uniref:Protein BREAKING OF ASYMMETRY IN THE STOMATAL LINEAGE n=1 Tax=Punica granatum TaxID=22663 RepID=A0A6P8DC57_PUNGR|nr:protein BREAKING OF ASYMMETRY IN THE STOMATAL LINEAGE [Punica granatum]
MAIVSEAGKERDKSKRSFPSHKRSEKDRGQIHGSESCMNRALAENWPNDSSWANSTDEDYIVFRIREDGVLDVVEDRKQEAASPNPLHKVGENSRSVNPKVRINCLDNESSAEPVQRCNYGQISNRDRERTADSNLMISENQNDEMGEESTRMRYDQIELDEENEGAQGRQSAGSDGSFSFPGLGWDWIGSPVEMPQPVERRRRTLRILFHCFKF